MRTAWEGPQTTRLFYALAILQKRSIAAREFKAVVTIKSSKANSKCIEH